MKLNNRGWGIRMMFILMTILIIFLFVAIYFIYNYYDKIENNNQNRIYETSGER